MRLRDRHHLSHVTPVTPPVEEEPAEPVALLAQAKAIGKDCRICGEQTTWRDMPLGAAGRIHRGCLSRERLRWADQFEHMPPPEEEKLGMVLLPLIERMLTDLRTQFVDLQEQRSLHLLSGKEEDALVKRRQVSVFYEYHALKHLKELLE